MILLLFYQMQMYRNVLYIHYGVILNKKKKINMKIMFCILVLVMTACLTFAVAAPAATTAAATVSTTAVVSTTSAWDDLTTQLSAWPLSGTAGFAVTVGNASGILFEYSRTPFTLHTSIETASTSKWPMAMMFTGLVQDGTIQSLDSYASDYVPWWSSDRTCHNATQCDAKGNITVRHLLSFTSGFDDGEVPGGGGGGGNATSCMDNSKGDYIACTKLIYQNLNLTGNPGRTFAYNSLHLQLMGAIAHYATKGLSIQAIFQKYYVTPCTFFTRHQSFLTLS